MKSKQIFHLDFSGELRKIPFVRLLIPFIFGILLCNYFSNLIFATTILGIIAFISLLCVFFSKKILENYSLRWIFGTILSIFIFSIGFIDSYFCTNKPPTSILQDSATTACGIIIQPPLIREKSTKTCLEIQAILQNNEWKKVNFKSWVYFRKDSNANLLCYGDKIILKTKFNNVTAPQNPREFDYQKYSANNDIFLQIFISKNEWTLIEKNQGNIFLLYADKLRTKLLKIYEKYGFEGEEFAVLSALTLGYRADIDNNLLQAYSASGAMHILSVSGMHVGIVALLIQYFLFFLDKPRFGKILKPLITLLFIWFFAFISGLSPAVLRATVMFSFVILGQSLQKNSNIYNTMAASAFFLLLWNPLLINDIGFVLSFIAVFSLVYFYPMIFHLYEPKNFISQKIWALTSVSVAAQIGTFPIGLYYFHQFPNYFLLGNFVAVPLSTIILAGGGLLFLVSFLEPVAAFLSILLNYSVKLLNFLVIFIENLPFSTIHGIEIRWLEMILLFGAIFSVSLFFTYRKIYLIKYGFYFIIAFYVFRLTFDFQQLKQKSFYVYAISGCSAYNFIDGEKNIFICDSNVTANKISFHLRNYWTSLSAHDATLLRFNELKINNLSPFLFYKDNFLSFHSLRIKVINSDFQFSKNISQKIKLDYLILSQNAEISISQLLLMFEVKEIIIDSSNSWKNVVKWKQQCVENQVNCYSVIEKGYFAKNL